LETADLNLECHDGNSLSPNSGSVRIRGSKTAWLFGEPLPNLKGTARTLDGVSGRTVLGDGVVSRSGMALLDDSGALLLNDEGWPVPNETSRIDWYFFGYGHDFAGALRDYYRLSGRVPLVPRYVLGNWWSKYWAYHDNELLEVVDRFRAMDIPLSVCIIDMDWHITDIPGVQDYWGGWTGYTVNRRYFPDFSRFIQQLHARGLKTSVNLHPANGVKAYEEQYPAFAQAMGLYPNTKETIPFDSTDPRFMKTYFRILLHPYERMGVDFWWIDWQQGTKTTMEGLDPLWMLNHLHYFDAAKNPDLRPFTFSRWAKYGAQRYPIGFSGDTQITWDSLRYQPYFTATAANIGFSMWSHDIGGHFNGTEDPELFVRWVQFGVFSPVMRLHSTSNRMIVREPWRHGPAVRTVVADFMRLRHRLIPYLYTLCHENSQGGLPPVIPAYYFHPESEAAYSLENGYFFGSQLWVQPVTKPVDSETHRANFSAWIPDGKWTDWFTGESFTGGKKVFRSFALDQQGVYAKAGAIIPLADHEGLTAGKNPDRFVVRVFPGADGEFVLFEDDGISPAYQNGEGFLTRFSLKTEGNTVTFRIEPDSLGKPYLPERRRFRIEFVNFQVTGENRPGTMIGNDFVIDSILAATEKTGWSFMGNSVDGNGAILRSLDSFLTDWVQSPVKKSAIYDAFLSARSLAAIRRSFSDVSLPIRRVLEGFAARMKTHRTRRKG